MKTRSSTGKKTSAAPTLHYAIFRHKLVGDLLLVADGDHLIRAIYTDAPSGKKKKAGSMIPRTPSCAKPRSSSPTIWTASART